MGSQPAILSMEGNCHRASRRRIEMIGYTEIATQIDLDALLDRTARFHDSMIKELHVVNRANVASDHSMLMNHRFDARLLLQNPMAAVRPRNRTDRHRGIAD